jgi:hypothetical protein
MGRLPLSFPICLAILNGSTMFVPARIRQKPRSSGARRNSGWEKRRPVAPTGIVTVTGSGSQVGNGQQ